MKGGSLGEVVGAVTTDGCEGGGGVFGRSFGRVLSSSSSLHSQSMKGRLSRNESFSSLDNAAVIDGSGRLISFRGLPSRASRAVVLWYLRVPEDAELTTVLLLLTFGLEVMDCRRGGAVGGGVESEERVEVARDEVE